MISNSAARCGASRLKKQFWNNSTSPQKFNGFRQSSRGRWKKRLGGPLIEHSHVPGQQFSLEQIQFILQHLLLQARTGFRSASRVVESVVEFFGIPWEVPDYTTGRTWLLRIALYQLERPKQQADDWIWIVDHTVQIGQEKCLVILGVRVCELPPPGECLRLEHLCPLKIYPVTHSDQHVVQAQLEETIQTTGVPTAILGDHGGDLQAGVNRFCQAHSATRNLYDIAHKAANLLKARLEKDESWKSFCNQVGQTKFQTQQTELAFLAPPSQRSKARYMNLDALLQWGRETLRLVDERSEEVLRHVSVERLEEKFGWLRRYRSELNLWSEYQALLSHSVDEIRSRGYSQSAAYQVALRLGPHVQTDAGRQLKFQLIAFIAGESATMLPHERLPGSSEVLESAFGQLKAISGDHQTGGFTSLLLAISALVGRIDRITIYDALVAVPWKNVCNWIQSNLGTTHQSKRRRAYKKTSAGATKPA